MLVTRRTVSQDGWVFIPELNPACTGVEIATQIGSSWFHERGGFVHRLTPSGIDDVVPNTYSGRYGVERFPLHTDLAHHTEPPRYFLLRCVRGYSEVSTNLIDGRDMVRSIGASLLARALVQPRRPRGGARPLLPIYQLHKGDHGLLRWDETYIQPASVAGEQAFASISCYLTKVAPTSIQLTAPGDTLIVDNWRMIHGRSAVPPYCQDRLIERAYLGDIH